MFLKIQYMHGAPTGTRTQINGLGNRGSILLNYEDRSLMIHNDCFSKKVNIT